MSDIQKLENMYNSALKSHEALKDTLGYDNHFLKVAEEVRETMNKLNN